jgi:RNA-directed DNA polymerase
VTRYTLERRGRVMEPNSAINQKWEESMNEAKPYQISKWEVWEAYKRVKAKDGAAGVDEQSIEDFEKDLKRT